jgi:hypothetical protein
LLGYDTLAPEVKAEIDALTKGYADKPQFFVDKLAEGVAMIAAAFYPKDVILRLSDFKSNEYAHLVGGKSYEPVEENPMIGFRGASRYYHPRADTGWRDARHAFSVTEAVELARALQQLPSRLIAYGIEGKNFSSGEQLSPEVAAAVEEVARRVKGELCTKCH